MALAGYFSKAALAASHVLRGFDLAAFQEKLEQQKPIVAFDRAALTTEGETALALAVNLLARLYPRIGLEALDTAGEARAVELRELATSINPAIETEPGMQGGTVYLVLGEKTLDLDVPTFYLGSDGWLAKLSTSRPVGSGESSNPFGAAAAACFGAANVFRVAFADQLDEGALDEEICLSLLNYRHGESASNDLIPPVDLGEAFLVGVGAVGNATWALARVPGATGILHLIDPEPVEASNLQRYVLTTREDEGAKKVELAEAQLKRGPASIHPVPHDRTWGEYLLERNEFTLERVAVALDSELDRIGVQASLPRWIVNAWTQRDNLGVSRHSFVDEKACLACLYLPDSKQKSDSERIAEEIGLSDAEPELRALLARRAPVTRDLLERIATANGIDVDALLPFEGVDLRAFHSRAVYGGLMLSLGADAATQPVEAPMAFQSALAGVMLAAELVIHAAHLGTTRPVRTEVNLLRRLGSYLSQEDQKHASGRCLCQDEDYRAVYHGKYLAHH